MPLSESALMACTRRQNLDAVRSRYGPRLLPFPAKWAKALLWARASPALQEATLMAATSTVLNHTDSYPSPYKLYHLPYPLSDLWVIYSDASTSWTRKTIFSGYRRAQRVSAEARVSGDQHSQFTGHGMQLVTASVATLSSLRGGSLVGTAAHHPWRCLLGDCNQHGDRWTGCVCNVLGSEPL